MTSSAAALTAGREKNWTDWMSVQNSQAHPSYILKILSMNLQKILSCRA